MRVDPVRLTAARMVAAVQQVLQDESFRNTAAAMGERLRSSSGAGTAAQLLLQFAAAGSSKKGHLAPQPRKPRHWQAGATWDVLASRGSIGAGAEQAGRIVQGEGTVALECELLPFNRLAAHATTTAERML